MDRQSHLTDVRNDDGNEEIDHDQAAPDDETHHQDHGEHPGVGVILGGVVDVIKLGFYNIGQ